MSASNKEKHGIDFDDVQQLWSGGKLVLLTATEAAAEGIFKLIQGYR